VSIGLEPVAQRHHPRDVPLQCLGNTVGNCGIVGALRCFLGLVAGVDRIADRPCDVASGLLQHPGLVQPLAGVAEVDAGLAGR
jgi:hypothetical protein